MNIAVMKNEMKRGIVFIVGLTMVLEILVFNFRHWESLTFSPVRDPIVITETGLEMSEDGWYQVIDSERAYLNLVGIYANIKNACLSITPKDGTTTQISVIANDAANSSGLNMGATSIVSTVPQSSYIRLHLNGMSDYVRIKVNQQNGFMFRLEQAKLNQTYPFHFSLLRISIVFIALLFFLIFAPKSPVYKTSLKLDTKSKKAGLIVYVGMHILVILMVSQLIDPDKTLQDSIDKNGWPAYGQYNELADALMKGQVYLDREPPKSLAMASNPYDGAIRWDAVVTKGGEQFDYDYSYFDGKYYSYFGPVPALIFFIPYKMVTGVHINTWDVVTLCAVLFCLAGFWLIYVIGRRYFERLSFGTYLLMASFYFFGSATVYLFYLGIVYSVPIITSLLFGTVGLSFWFLAKDEQQLRKSYLTVGAAFIALIIGCRPQLAIVLFLAFPIFWKEITIERNFFSKKGLVNTLCVVIPFLIVGCSIMYYNYVRFHSPFDFGATYNLTSNDMTHRGVVMDRFPLGIFTYLFQPLNIIPKYPFMHTVNVANDYLGFTNVEPLFGGFFIMNFLAAASVLVFKLKKNLKEYSVYGTALFCFGMAIIIMLLDIQMAGLTQRYMSDFGWLFVLSAILVLFTMEQLSVQYGIGVIFIRIQQILVLASIVINLWSILITERYFSLINIRPEVFYYIKYLFFSY